MDFASYHSPSWLPGGHAQTLYPLLIKPGDFHYHRERWETPDGDFIDLDWLDAAHNAPLIVVFHGLEGGSNSHYATSLMVTLKERGWAGVVAHFRGCSGEPNRLPRAYHSGDSEEVDWILRKLRQQFPTRVILAVGFSLGGNALLKWLGESELMASQVIDAAASVCAPLDLTICGHHLGRGFNQVYTRHFLKTLKAHAREKLARFPGIFDHRRLANARNLYEFDDAFTAPMHGFLNADDYWQRASAKPFLGGIRLPTLLLQAVNDPFLPPYVLPSIDEVSILVKREYQSQGGHVGFVAGSLPGHLRWLPQRLLCFFDKEI